MSYPVWQTFGMNQRYSEIAFVLDRSGSMGACRKAAIQGFNHFLHEQQQIEGLCKLTLILFDDDYQVPIKSLPAAEILPLNTETYTLGGSTALLDAIGRTVDDLGARLAAIPEADRPGQVVVAILTDGFENFSQKYTWREIARLIRQQTEQYRWSFLFLGANQDAIATAAQLSIAPANAATYVTDTAGLRAASGAISRRVSAMRRVASGKASCREVEEASTPLSELHDDERGGA